MDVKRFRYHCPQTSKENQNKEQDGIAWRGVTSRVYWIFKHETSCANSNTWKYYSGFSLHINPNPTCSNLNVMFNVIFRSTQ